MRKCLLALTAVGAVMLFFAVASAAGTIPGSSYQWQQPGSAPVRMPPAQPQLPRVQVRLTGLQEASSMAYVWTQPGAAPVSPPDAQPW
jgi:hypothetical protein